LSVRVGGQLFEEISYDDVADVLYLRNEHHGEGVSTYGTPEGHAVRLDGDGNVVGMTIVNARWLIERDGTIVVSVPQQRIEVPAKDLDVALERATSE
jgi:uncharacterized protein YuzE